MKILNKRPIVLFAVLMVAIVLILLYHNSLTLKICLLSVGLGVAIISLIVYILVKNKICKYVFSRLLIAGICCAISVGTICTHEAIYNRDYREYNGYATVSGRVAQSGDFYNGNCREIVLDNVSLHTENYNQDLHGKARFTVLCDLADEDIFVVGTNIVANAKISYAKLYYKGEYGLSFNYAINNITCSGYIVETNIEIITGELDLSVPDKIKNKVSQIVEHGLDEEYSGLALGMLFGDRDTLNTDVANDFSATGIAHLLAVSGLHVGFLLTILLLFCKLFKIRGVAKFTIVSALLLFYAYLCGFSISVVRATIMAICMLYAGCRYKRYDSLNALAIAAILVTLIMPFSITTVGFRLSFMAVLSILLLTRPLSKLLSKIFKDKMANTIATMLAVQIGTSGVVISAFKNITLVGIVANFVSIPLASAAYMILFVTIIISLILPFANIVVYLFQFVMQIVVKFVHLLAQVNILQFKAWQGTAIMYSSLPTMYLSSNYLFFNKRIKAVVCIVLWVAISVLLFL